jgi:hypothetical protein
MKNTPIKCLIGHQRPHWSTDSLYIKQQFSTHSAYQRLFPDFSAACYCWLAYVLKRLPLAETADAYDQLMPWTIKPEDLITDIGR